MSLKVKSRILSYHGITSNGLPVHFTIDLEQNKLIQLKINERHINIQFAKKIAEALKDVEDYISNAITKENIKLNKKILFITNPVKGKDEFKDFELAELNEDDSVDRNNLPSDEEPPEKEDDIPF